MKPKTYLVCEAHELVDSTHYLTNREIKLIQLCLANIYQVDAIDPEVFYEVDKQEYAKLYGMTDRAAYEALVEVSKTLQSRLILLKSTLLYPESPARSKTSIGWVSACRYNPETSKVELKWSKEIIRLIAKLGAETPYSKYYLHDVCELNTIHAIRLYRIVNKWAFARTKTFELDEFRRLMGLTAVEFAQFKHLNNQVIKPSMDAINSHTNLKVKVEFIRIGNGVRKLKFNVSVKEVLDQY